MLYFDTRTEWLSHIKAWTEVTPEVERVWVYGSRATGVRRVKPAPSLVPDLDIAYTLQGDQDDMLALMMMESGDWSSALQDLIPVDLDLQLAQPDDKVVWPRVKAHGVLIFDRTN